MSDSQRECIDWWVAKAGRLEAEIEQLRTENERLKDTFDAVRKYIDALDLIEPPSTQAQQFCHAVRSILEANDE